MEKNNQIFDNYEVDCNTCERYWTDQCDAVKIEDKRKCNSYIATRKINVVEEVADCKEKIKELNKFTIRISVCFLLYLVLELIGKCLT